MVWKFLQILTREDESKPVVGDNEKKFATGWETITMESVMANYTEQLRTQSFTDSSGLRHEGTNRTFRVFSKTAKMVFEYQTGLELTYWVDDNDWTRNINLVEWEQIERWEEAQGTLVFIRDCLTLSVALGTSRDERRILTNLGRQVHDAKKYADLDEGRRIAILVTQRIQELPIYSKADLVCATPNRPNKVFDLVNCVATIVSEKTGKQDISNGFVVKGDKPFIRETKFEDKWSAWKDAQVHFRNSPETNVTGKTVILIDDYYQSGTSMQFTAMKLQQAGAREVYGMCLLKTVRDTDNL